jgi:hypothetical protein
MRTIQGTVPTRGRGRSRPLVWCVAALSTAFAARGASAQSPEPPSSATAQEAAPEGTTGQSCVSAYEEAQEMRRQSRLVRARAELLLCQRACPTMLTRDCDRWLAEVRTAIPTVMLSARDASGAPLADVRVRVDGAPLVETLAGTAVEIDPGAHVFDFERHAGGAAVQTQVTVRPGERNRPVAVTFPDAPAQHVDARPPTLTWVLGGVAVAGLGVGAVLGLKGHADRADLEDDCSPSCPDDRVQPIRTQWWIAGISAGVGAAAGIAAAWIWLSADGTPRPGRAGTRDLLPRAIHIGAAPAPGGGYAVLTGQF